MGELDDVGAAAKLVDRVGTASSGGTGGGGSPGNADPAGRGGSQRGQGQLS
jgi:hypothetical protein